MHRYSNIESVFHTNVALGGSKLEEHEPTRSKHKKGKPIKVEKNPKAKQH
jgi:hypothetical protein